MPEESFDKRLKEALTKRNMKPIELANKLNIHRGIISKYLNGNYRPKYDRVYEIAQVLSISEAWLLGYDVPMESEAETITEDEFIQLVNSYLSNPDIPKEKKETILQNAIDNLKASIK